MPNDKDIKIKIGTEADVSGAKEVDKALGVVTKSAKQLERGRAQFLSAAEAEVAEVNRLSKAADQLRDSASGVSDAVGRGRGSRKGAAGAMKELARETPKATKSTRNSGLAALEASRAFEDMRYGIRGALSNIPGLVLSLGGTAGIAGAASAAAVAVSILAPKMKDLFGSAQEDADAAEELADRLKELAEKAADVAREQQNVANERFKESIDAVAESLRLENNEFDRSLGLIHARRDAKVKLIEAEKQLALAQVDTDEGLSDEEKIRRRGSIETNSSQAKRALEVESINDQVKVASQAFGKAIDQNAGNELAVTAAEQSLERQQERRNELKKRSVAAREARLNEDRLVKLKEEEARLQEEVDSSDSEFDPVAPGVLKRLNEVQRDRAHAEERIEISRSRAQGFGRRDQAELDGLEEKDGKPGSLAKLKEEIEELKKTADLSAVSLSEAKKQLAVIDEIAEVQRSSTRRTGALRDETSELRSADAVRREQERVEEERQKAEAARIREEEKLKQKANQEGSRLSDRIIKTANRTSALSPAQTQRVRSRAEALQQDGVQSGELEAVGSVIDQVLDLLLKDRESQSRQANEFREHKRKLAVLEGQVRGGRDGQ